MTNLDLYLSGNNLGGNNENMKMLATCLNFLQKLRKLNLYLDENNLGQNAQDIK